MFLRISDRYIIRSFLVSFAICFAALVSLFVIIDTFSNIGNLVERWDKSGEGFMAFVKMLLEMNVTLLPVILYELLPVLTLASAMFTVVALRRSNELTPLLASGVSIYRVLWPIFMMAILVTGLQIADKEILIPRYADSIYEWMHKRKDESREVVRRVMVEDGYGNLVYAGEYKPEERVQLGARIARYGEGAGAARARLIVNAQRAEWSDEPAGWRYWGGTRIEFDREGDVVSQESVGEEGIFVRLVIDAEDVGELELVTDVTPVRLETDRVDLLYRPSMELLEYIQEHGMRASVAFELNSRMAAPLANVVLLLVGLPFVLKRDVKSPFLAIVVAVGIAGAFLALDIVCKNFAMRGTVLTPLAGAWAPIIIFGPLGVLIFDTIES